MLRACLPTQLNATGQFLYLCWTLVPFVCRKLKVTLLNSTQVTGNWPVELSWVFRNVLNLKLSQLNGFASSGTSSTQSWPSWIKCLTTIDMKKVYVKYVDYQWSLMTLLKNVTAVIRCENKFKLQNQQMEDDTGVISTIYTLLIA